MKVQNKVFVVTGAGNGIGRELTLGLLARGARVAGVDLNATSLEETSRLAEPHQGRFASFLANIADQSAVDTLPGRVRSHFGAVDGIINNAGIIQPFLRLQELDYATIERVLHVNLFGTLFVTKAFLPELLQRPEAHIINLSSMGGIVPVPGQTIYCAAKAAVKLLSEGLASELLTTRVRVTVVFPGAVATNIRSNSGVNGSPRVEAGSAQKALAPVKAAEIILRGMERNAYHVFVGQDAALMDKLSRLSPSYAARAIAKKMRDLLPH
jgi:short-subunit dehydrogenase